MLDATLVNKGLIPKDVDLTPAFEKGAPPVTCKGVKFYDKREQYVKRTRGRGGSSRDPARGDYRLGIHSVDPDKRPATASEQR